jgi:hypothetical protein
MEFIPKELKRKIWKEKYEPLLRDLKKWREEKEKKHEKTKNNHSRRSRRIS